MTVLAAIGRGALITVAVLAVLAGTLYLFGGMWVRSPEMQVAYEEAVVAGDAGQVEGTFVIPIPGCVCHSNDPIVQAEHAERRIRDCRECH